MMEDKENETPVFNRLISLDGLFIEIPSNINFKDSKIDTIANRRYDFVREELGNLWTNNSKLDRYDTVLIRTYAESRVVKNEWEPEFL